MLKLRLTRRVAIKLKLQINWDEHIIKAIWERSLPNAKRYRPTNGVIIKSGLVVLLALCTKTERSLIARIHKSYQDIWGCLPKPSTKMMGSASRLAHRWLIPTATSASSQMFLAGDGSAVNF